MRAITSGKRSSSSFCATPAQSGWVLLMASVDDRVRPGLVCAPAVRWGKRAGDRRNVNALTSTRLTDFGGGPTFYSCLVQVERSGD